MRFWPCMLRGGGAIQITGEATHASLIPWDSSQSLTLSWSEFLPFVIHLHIHIKKKKSNKDGCHLRIPSVYLDKMSACTVSGNLWVAVEFDVQTTSFKSQVHVCFVLDRYFFWVIFVFLIRVDLHDFKLKIDPRSSWQEFESVILDKLIWFLLIFGKLNVNLNPALKITLTKSKHKPDPWTSTTKYSTQNFLLMLFSWHLFLGSFYFSTLHTFFFFFTTALNSSLYNRLS